ncbi:MOSC domain-containing protein [Listeria cossartiae subsp. cayugensis]|uniref:MOSC domain-containing protein n=1 Tax=Listeria cossartiae TaxID=2838249 RepID=UPI00288000D3|nr:MOSC domain-containing protein [Listeria cossartiae]MDT0000360.1 MOSC domain-containing protein [Listeria cossartiae subsp. cayugensis]MDT0003560.1 MOSC domain-containing protein [Listeria cossartiae subsp. cayugensis]MDT0008552.1 MOSC domain-containing protein [Listeria cossartiae subsp. cayugensis]MDT0019954.1 MOSC domain-containing protein [Listeria cossartiae subsp. cayugensis]MDT0030384.1 MOSC domain-containing protein [Listeria cossartiae subsp. cayugensis]
MERKIIHLAVGKPKELDLQNNKKMMTGIEKQRVKTATLTMNGFENDAPHNLKYHGGVDRTVCIYPYEHYAKWAEMFGEELQISAFGENLIVTNMLEKTVQIGDKFQIGETIIQVTEARNPCSTIEKFNAIPNLYKAIHETGFTGYLCRTITPGLITETDEIKPVHQESHGVTVAFCHEKVLHKKGTNEDFERILAVEALSERYRDQVEKRIKK